MRRETKSARPFSPLRAFFPPWRPLCTQFPVTRRCHNVGLRHFRERTP